MSLSQLVCRTFSLTFVRIVIYAFPDTVAATAAIINEGPSLNVGTGDDVSRRRAVFVSPLKSIQRIHYCASYEPLTQITIPIPRTIVACKLAFLRSRLAWLRSPYIISEYDAVLAGQGGQSFIPGDIYSIE